MARDLKPHNLNALIVLAPVLYALSAGPVVKVDKMLNPGNWGIPSSGVLAFYWPLSWFGDHVPPAGLMLQSYVNFWRQL